MPTGGVWEGAARRDREKRATHSLTRVQALMFGGEIESGVPNPAGRCLEQRSKEQAAGQ